jgi:hypothetical protein
MSRHHPFQRLVENLPEERKLAIPQSGGSANEQKKKTMLAEIELREAIESSIANWHLDPAITSIEQVDACLNYLRQSVRDLGRELTITAKFPDMVEISIDSVKSMSD